LDLNFYFFLSIKVFTVSLAIQIFANELLKWSDLSYV